jgi:glycosyltransferase involved in cell wall biosynthesis
LSANLPLVSAIIPVYNAAATLSDTIKSALVQKDNSFNLEIIVVNDGSKDQSQIIIDNYKDQCKSITTENRGVSAARTLGLENAGGDYIQYLDSDDLLMPGKIMKQLAALEEKKADVAYGDWQKFVQRGEEIDIIETITRKINGRPEIDIFGDFWCPPAALLFSRKITDQLKWNKNLPVIQDARYLLDAALIAKFIYVPGVQAQYRVHQSGSLSQRNPLAFVTDCFVNDCELYELWKNDLATDPEKKQALINSLRYCINEFSIAKSNFFEPAVDLLLKISPGYIPSKPALHRNMSKIFGFKNAERLAAIKRKLSK